MNTHFGVVLRIRESGSVNALACRGDIFFTYPVRTAHQGMFRGL